ncbi:hypothetical protein BJX66DRAFT_320693 [Aspergillus keveii]|uniref:Uncharacterized protein n=1 Tax=Aspergillus keveii TaxID=714993 RepID=A0ABR4FGT4_9EURO
MPVPQITDFSFNSPQCRNSKYRLLGVIYLDHVYKKSKNSRPWIYNFPPCRSYTHSDEDEDFESMLCMSGKEDQSTCSIYLRLLSKRCTGMLLKL